MIDYSIESLIFSKNSLKLFGYGSYEERHFVRRIDLQLGESTFLGLG